MQLTHHNYSLPPLSTCSIDLELADWYTPASEWISTIQIAYRNPKIEVHVFDAQHPAIREIFFPILSDPTIAKAFHNAAYDVNKLQKLWGITTQNAYCTMKAARTAGYSKYNLKDLAANILGVHLNKSYQHSDFSRRPLNASQIKYAAEDAITTLLLFEHQSQMNQQKRYHVKHTPTLPFSDLGQAIQKIISLKPGLTPEYILANCLGPRSGIFGYYLDEAIGNRSPDEKEVREVLATFKDGLRRILSIEA